MKTRQMLKYATLPILALMGAPAVTLLAAEQHPAEVIKMDYISPLSQAIALQDELNTYSVSPRLVATSALGPPPSGTGGPPVHRRAIALAFAFEMPKLFNKEYPWSPHPFVSCNFVPGNFKVSATGRYFYSNLEWEVAGEAELAANFSLFVGLSYPRTSVKWQEFTVGNQKMRYKMEVGVKFSAKPGGKVTLDARGDFTDSSKQVTVNGGAICDFTAELVAPKIYIQKYVYQNTSSSGWPVFKWIDLPIYAPTNGIAVNGLVCEMTAFGKLALFGGVRYQCWDNFPNSDRSRANREEFELVGKVVGRCGAKVKIKVGNYPEFSKEVYWEQTIAGDGVTIDSGSLKSAIDPTTAGHDPVKR